MISWKIRSIVMLGLLVPIMSCGEAASPSTSSMQPSMTETPPIFMSITPGKPTPTSQVASSPQLTAQNNQALTFTTVIQGARSGGHGESPSVRFVRSDKERGLLTTEISDEHVPAVNAVDLSTNMLVAAFQGLKPTSGYQIEIITISVAQEVLTITVGVTSPAPGAPVRQGFETPYHIVQISPEQFDATHSARYLLLDARGSVLAGGPIPRDSDDIKSHAPTTGDRSTGQA